MDNEANEASKRAENLWRNNIEAYNKGTETRTDGTLIREITHFGDEMLEYAQIKNLPIYFLGESVNFVIITH